MAIECAPPATAAGTSRRAVDDEREGPGQNALASLAARSGHDGRERPRLRLAFDVRDERMVRRAPLCGVDARHRALVERARRQAVDGLGRHRDEAACRAAHARPRRPRPGRARRGSTVRTRGIMAFSARALRLPSGPRSGQLSDPCANCCVPRTLSLLALAALVAVPVAVAMVACGGSEQPPADAAPASDEPGRQRASAVSAAPAATATATATASAAPPPPAPAPTSTVATTKTDAAWAACHPSFKAKRKDVSNDVAAMAKACATATKMKLVGKTLTGKQARRGRAAELPVRREGEPLLPRLRAGSDGIKDLDLVVKDSAGIVVGQDSTDDPSPVVLEDGAVCFSKDDKASVVVSVGMGKGSYAVQVWGD